MSIHEPEPRKDSSHKLLRLPLVQLDRRIWLGIRLRLRGPPRRAIDRRLGIHPKIPHVKIHSFFAEQLDHCIFARRERLGRRDLYPSAGELLRGGRHQFLLLADFTVHSHFNIPKNALPVFLLNAHDFEAVERQFWLYRLLRFWRFVPGGVTAGQFNHLLGAGYGIDRRPQNIALCILLHLSGVLIDGHQLRFVLKIIEQKDAAFVRQLQARCNMRAPQLLLFPLRFQLAIKFDDFGSRRPLGPVFFVLIGRFPIDQRLRQFFPLVALGAQVAHPLSLDFILGHQLVGAVFEDQPLGKLLRVNWTRASEKPARRQRQDNSVSQPASHRPISSTRMPVPSGAMLTPAARILPRVRPRQILFPPRPRIWAASAGSADRRTTAAPASTPAPATTSRRDSGSTAGTSDRCVVPTGTAAWSFK